MLFHKMLHHGNDLVLLGDVQLPDEEGVIQGIPRRLLQLRPLGQVPHGGINQVRLLRVFGELDCRGEPDAGRTTRDQGDEGSHDKQLQEIIVDEVYSDDSQFYLGTVITIL